ncbi:DNA primase [Alteromonas mediterranea]|jgi:DNA primase|uniref:DNA primase n=4 Tax=Alteromonas mediterranea TaxID=314275 RepID=S5ABA7_9ALTE|nr:MULTISPECIES: DNA primase [Alteromonas]AGP76985.1 DNA primase [Alteromonas mediterranea 615]MBR9783796.1 DNA primase [Gammaproteobacteria bacterium]MEA3380177.1 DNA primase [Pseudomonadota bacterium]AFV84220.1 DNA primase [Alteromonas mediterranea DE1]AGP80659.1 DNA primase [Alteromonas mediterranea MED64]|tara:strand:+ start:710 stop:2488 length:1779 start_codon:yes stop_codon:yes gene_type:complete
MAGKIPRDFIDDLLSRTDVVEVVDSRVKLKKAGKNYQACCPFHNEKSPSFTVSQDKQFFHCFGCGAHGNAISFIMEFDRLEFVEAIEELARYHGLEVPREKGSRPAMSEEKKQQQQDDYAVMEQVARFFQHQLRQNGNSKKAIEYLKNRGLSGDIVKQWEIGYAPDSWDALLNTFGKDPQRIKQLVDLKLVNKNDQGRTYDFFRDRIMFPIRDKRGRVVGFGGRVLDDGGPKYLNSPETRIFHKGSELFGFYSARQNNRTLDTVVIVEGYMDVVALSQFDINIATAALGTATTPEHIQMLVRATSHIVCCYDGDRAGREAAWRALENALPALKDGVRISFLFLPDGEDPDTMVRQVGKEAFMEMLDSAMPLSRFFFENLLKTHNVGTPEGKIALKKAAMPLIESTLGEDQKQMLLEELAKHTGEFDRFKLQQDITKANQGSKQAYSPSRNQVNKPKLSPLRMLIRLLLDKPELASMCEDVQIDIFAGSKAAGMDLLRDVHRYCLANPKAKTAQLVENFRDHPHSSTIAKLLLQEHLVKDEDAERVYNDSFARLLDGHFDSRIETLISRSRVQPLTQAEKQELNLLMRERQKS